MVIIIIDPLTLVIFDQLCRGYLLMSNKCVNYFVDIEKLGRWVEFYTEEVKKGKKAKFLKHTWRPLTLLLPLFHLLLRFLCSIVIIPHACHLPPSFVLTRCCTQFMVQGSLSSTRTCTDMLTYLYKASTTFSHQVSLTLAVGRHQRPHPTWTEISGKRRRMTKIISLSYLAGLHPLPLVIVSIRCSRGSALRNRFSR